MKRVSDSMMYAWVGAALGLGVVAGGCSDNNSKPAAKKPGTSDTALKAGANAATQAAVPLMVEYQEIPVGKRLVIVGSKKSADLVKQHGKPPSYVSEVGYGMDGQTVYFENKPEGMEKALKAEYAKRHPGAGK